MSQRLALPDTAHWSRFLACECESLKAYVSEEILNWHCLSVSLNADLCILFYWLSRLRLASHRKMIQSSALRLRLWLCQFKISSDTLALTSAVGDIKKSEGTFFSYLLTFSHFVYS